MKKFTSLSFSKESSNHPHTRVARIESSKWVQVLRSMTILVDSPTLRCNTGKLLIQELKWLVQGCLLFCHVFFWRDAKKACSCDIISNAVVKASSWCVCRLLPREAMSWELAESSSFCTSFVTWAITKKICINFCHGMKVCPQICPRSLHYQMFHQDQRPKLFPMPSVYLSVWARCGNHKVYPRDFVKNRYTSLLHKNCPKPVTERWISLVVGGHEYFNRHQSSFTVCCEPVGKLHQGQFLPTNLQDLDFMVFGKSCGCNGHIATELLDTEKQRRAPFAYRGCNYS